MRDFRDTQFQEIAAEKIFKKTFTLVFRAEILNLKNKHKTTKKNRNKANDCKRPFDMFIVLFSCIFIKGNIIQTINVHLNAKVLIIYDICSVKNL